MTYLKIILFLHKLLKIYKMKGTVKWFDQTKGFGFITSEDGNEVFVHYTGIKGDGFVVLEEGEEVEFEITEGKRGPQAIDVVRGGDK